jgi:hypothetical protein
MKASLVKMNTKKYILIEIEIGIEKGNNKRRDEE